MHETFVAEIYICAHIDFTEKKKKNNVDENESRLNNYNNTNHFELILELLPLHNIHKSEQQH